MLKNTEIQEHLPYSNKTVYFSGSIKGAPEADPEFAWKLVHFMKINGAEVLSEHVAGRTQKEKDIIRANKMGIEIQEMLSHKKPWEQIRKLDMNWVDESTHFVGLINAPSHGVGMEIERAILKPQLSLNLTPILLLIHEDLIEKTSFMIRGVTKEEHPYYYIETYNSLEEAQEKVDAFLRAEYKV